MLLALAVFSVASCDTGEIDYTPLEKSIKIVSQNVSDMSAVASQGEIVVEAPGTVTATTSSDWLTLSVSGNKVNVQTTNNGGIDYRSAKIVLSCGDESVDVAVLQKGAVFVINASSLACNNKGKTFTVNYSSNMPTEFQSTASWLSYKAADGVLSITADANTTGKLRTGYIVYKAGNTEGKIRVSQGEVANLLGDYYLAFEEEGELSAIPVTISANGKNYQMTMSLAPTLQFATPVTFDANNLSLTLAAGANLGKYATYDVYMLAYDVEAGNLTWSSTVSSTAQFLEDEGSVYADFLDNGSWSGYKVTGLALGAFNGAPSGSTYAGGLMYMEYPFLMKLDSPAAKNVKVRRNLLK